MTKSKVDSDMSLLYDTTKSENTNHQSWLIEHFSYLEP